MAHYILDIETDNLLDKMTTVHMICLRDVDKDTVRVFHNEPRLARDHQLTGAKLRIEQADSIIGHNLIGFDLPALEQQFGWTFPDVQVWDTLVLARLCYADVGKMDWAKINRGGTMPKKLAGRHSLEAWGHRLKCHKGDFNDYETLTQEMIDYCIQDTKVTRLLFDLLRKQGVPKEAWKLEHDFAGRIDQMCRRGVELDVDKAEALYADLVGERTKLDAQLEGAFEPRTIVSFTKVKKLRREKVVPLNPNSRQQVAWHLTNKYGWKPKRFSECGGPTIDEKTFEDMPYPEAPLLARRLMIQKRIGTVAEGKGALLKLVKGTRLHGSVMHIGTNTHRCSHARPNLGNQTSMRLEYGPEIRELFTVKPGHKLVGCDVAGLELRMLAHYMSRWDDGEYVKLILDGDIHTANQEAAGLDTRDQAKTFIYAFLYGAGDAKIGSIVGGGAKAGKALKEKFFAVLPALKYLQQLCQKKHREQRAIRGLDGRHIPTRSEHSALNTLLQGAGAVLVKQATVSFCAWMDLQVPPDDGTWGGLVLHVHDEFQAEVHDQSVEFAEHFAPAAVVHAGKVFELRCPMNAEAKVGTTWCETH